MIGLVLIPAERRLIRYDHDESEQSRYKLLSLYDIYTCGCKNSSDDCEFSVLVFVKSIIKNNCNKCARIESASYPILYASTSMIQSKK